MKKAKKRKLKLKFLKVVDTIADNGVKNLTLIRSCLESIYISFFIILLSIGFNLIKTDYIIDPFEIFIIFSILIIMGRLVRINLSSGYLGAGNLAFLILGIIGSLTQDFNIINNGIIIIDTFFLITLACIIYVVVRDWRKIKNVH
jgi:hypothetical protein